MEIKMFDNRLKKEAWEVKSVGIKEAKALIEQHHYSKSCSKTGVYIHGLYSRKDNKCYGVVWWLPPMRNSALSVNKENPDKVLNLSRMVIVPDVPKNACSFLLGTSIRMIRKEKKYKSLVTYACESQNHEGRVYLSCNFIYNGKTSCNPRWIDPTTGKQISAKATKNRSVN